MGRARGGMRRAQAAEETLSTDDLIAHCRRFLANYKIPRHIEFSETELPKSGSGKILKRLLRERFWVGQKRALIRLTWFRHGAARAHCGIDDTVMKGEQHD